MESFSDSIKIRLKLFLQLWLQERGEFQELQITPTHIVLEANNHSNIYRTTVNDKLGYNSYRCKNQHYIDSP